MGPATRGLFYGYHKSFFGDNIRCSSGAAYSSSLVDRETIERLENTISKLTEELAAQRERFAEQREAEKDGGGNNIINQNAAAAVQLFHSDGRDYLSVS